MTEAGLFEELIKFLKIKSIATNRRAIFEACDFLCNLLKRLGCKVYTLEGAKNPVLFAMKESKTHSKAVLFYNHYDVVGNFFGPRVEGELLYGRGSADNKGNLFSRFGVLLEEPKVTIKFLIEGEEELGSPNLPKIVHKYRDLLHADLCIWEDGTRDESGAMQIYLGCKGILPVELRIKGKSIHSSMGAVVKNPAWRMIHALSTIVDKKGRIKIAGFYDSVEEPSQEIISYIERLPLNIGCAPRIEGLTETGAKRRLYLEPCVNIDMIKTDRLWGFATILPSKITAKLDFRLVPNQTPDVILLKFKRHLLRYGFDDINVDSKGGYPAARTSLHHPYISLVRDCIKRIYGKEAAIYPMLPSSGPMYLFSGDIPCVGVGINHPKSNPHADDESIYINDFFLGIKLIKSICTA